MVILKMVNLFCLAYKIFNKKVSFTCKETLLIFMLFPRMTLKYRLLSNHHLIIEVE